MAGQLTSMRNIEMFGAVAQAYQVQAGELAQAASSLRAAPGGHGQLITAGDMLKTLHAARDTAAQEIDRAKTGMLGWAGATNRLQNIHLNTHGQATQILGNVLNAHGKTADVGA